MTPHDLDTLTTRALADLDAAPPSTPTSEQVARADAALAGILASDRDTTALPLPRPTRRLTARRVAAVGVLAAACTTGVVALQALTGGESAAASWTAAPHTPTTPEQAAAGDACRATLSGSLTANDPTGVTAQALESASVVVSEQRGDVTLVVLGDGRGLDATCLTRPGGMFGSATVGSVGYAPTPTASSREVLVTGGGSATLDDSAISVLLGFVGSEVVAVTVHTLDHGDVAATVANGHLAAWWPGGTMAGAGADPRATITFADGTTQTRRLGM